MLSLLKPGAALVSTTKSMFIDAFTKTAWNARGRKCEEEGRAESCARAN